MDRAEQLMRLIWINLAKEKRGDKGSAVGKTVLHEQLGMLK